MNACQENMEMHYSSKYHSSNIFIINVLHNICSFVLFSFIFDMCEGSIGNFKIHEFS